MADDTIQQDAAGDGSDSIEVGAPELAWSQAWQIPVLLLGLGLLVIGVYFALPKYSVPDYPGVLSDVEVHLKAGELEQAEAKLTKLEADPLFKQKAGDKLKAHKEQLFGDLLFQQIDKRVWQGITTQAGKENLQLIRSRYHKAEQMGREMPPPALRRYAQTLAALGEDDGALQVVDQMPADMTPPRYMIVREMIEKRIEAAPATTSKQLSRLVERFERELESEADPARRREQQVWVMALRCERLLQAGDADGVIALLVEGGLLGLIERGATERDLAPLTVRLGEAYARLGKFESARQHLRQAQQHLGAGNPLNARIRVAFGDITLAEENNAGAIEQAYNHYRQAYDADKMGPSSIDALIGLGHTEANRSGRFPEAIEWFKLAVERIKNQQIPPQDARRKRLAHYLRDVHVTREYERGRYREALELLKAYAPLETPELSAETLKAFASIHEKLGQQSLDKARALRPDPASPGVDPNVEARKLHNQDAALSFEKAAGYYRKQAEQLTHTTEAHGDALWKAAKNYERAQLWGEAVDVYSDFLATSDRADRREEAAYRVAQALLAEGQHDAAVQRFRQIIDSAPAGEWAKRSYVPMSQALAAADRWDEAENLLRSVIEDHPSIGPESPFFHDALIALGKLLYNRGSQDPSYYARAIEVLGDEGGAVERFRHDPRYQDEMPRLRYMLADALRLSARVLIEAAEQARTESERMEKLSARIQRLSDAQMYYNQVVVELERWHPDAFSQTELLYFRNAQFYQADCAFERGDYEAAIALYLNAVSRWRDHPAALVGWVQIMNARAELGQDEAARSARVTACRFSRGR